MVQFKGPANFRPVPLVKHFSVDQAKIEARHDIGFKRSKILRDFAIGIFPDPGPESLILRQKQVYSLICRCVIDDLVEFQSDRQIANAGIWIDLLKIPNPPLRICQWVLPMTKVMR